MANEKDIENIINLLDGKTSGGVDRINLRVAQDEAGGEVYHHGRCDVGSPWANGTVGNPECKDIPDLEEE